MRGCFLVFGVLGLLLVLAIIIAGVSSSSSHVSSSGQADFTAPQKSTKHGWVTVSAMGNVLDFWHDPADECASIDVAANELVAAQQEGRDADTSVVNRVPGHRDLASGIRVQILGHAVEMCHGTAMNLTRVKVIDADSSLNGQSGYLVEGRLSHQ